MEFLEAFEWLRTVHPFVFGLIAFVFGACIGSFLNVCIYRIPEGVSLIRPGSRCPACETPIRWYDNLPVLGWLRLRGKARCCGARISPRYPLVEALTGGLFTVALLLHPFPLGLVWVTFIAILITVTFIDLDHLIIPDRFSIGGTFLFLFLALLVPEIHGYQPLAPDAGLLSLRDAVVGAAFGTATVYWISAIGEAILGKEAMGQGDFKLMGMIGAALGWQGALFAVFGGAFVGTVLLLPVMLWQAVAGKDQETVPESVAVEPEGDSESEEIVVGVGFGMAVPFGPMLAAGAVLYLLVFRGLVDNYFEDAAAALRILV